jgi:hypothetical protein
MLLIVFRAELELRFTYITTLESIVGVVWNGQRLSVLTRDEVIYVRILRGIEAS